MRLAISRSRESVWVWLFWGLGIYLLLEFGSFLLAAMLLKKTIGELVIPYIAFAIPWVIFAPIIWWLRKWEEQGASPTRLARLWALGVAVFGTTIYLAAFYSARMLDFMSGTDALIDCVVVVLLTIPVLTFVLYQRAIRVLSARTALKPASDRAK
jgi:hypothetical protein